MVHPPIDLKQSASPLVVPALECLELCVLLVPRPAASPSGLRSRCRPDRQRQADHVVVTAVARVDEVAQRPVRPIHGAAALELAQALAEVDLDRVAGERVRTFSAGMKRRLALARCALAHPRVLLLDEPFGGLDQRARKWLEGRLEAFKREGSALLLVTHSFGRELGVADRIAILAGGRIALDTPRAGLAPDDVQRLYATHTEDAP